jgi:hypothetical protein
LLFHNFRVEVSRNANKHEHGSRQHSVWWLLLLCMFWFVLAAAAAAAFCIVGARVCALKTA